MCFRTFSFWLSVHIYGKYFCLKDGWDLPQSYWELEVRINSSSFYAFLVIMINQSLVVLILNKESTEKDDRYILISLLIVIVFYTRIPISTNRITVFYTRIPTMSTWLVDYFINNNFRKLISIVWVYGCYKIKLIVFLPLFVNKKMIFVLSIFCFRSFYRNQVSIFF